jgi:predicted metalloprotease with PDZ domain
MFFSCCCAEEGGTPVVTGGQQDDVFNSDSVEALKLQDHPQTPGKVETFSIFGTTLEFEEANHAAGKKAETHVAPSTSDGCTAAATHMEAASTVQFASSEVSPQTVSQPLTPELPAAPIQPAPTASRETYVVEVTKGPKGLGLGLDMSDQNICVIKGVVPGSAMHDWNDKCAQGAAIRGGQRLLSVNGFSGETSALVQKMVEENTVKLMIEKPKECNISVKKNGRTLGLSVKALKDTFGAIITDIQPGAILDPADKIRCGDRIVCVNGKAGDPMLLLETMKTADDLELKLLSYS